MATRGHKVTLTWIICGITDLVVHMKIVQCVGDTVTKNIDFKIAFSLLGITKYLVTRAKGHANGRLVERVTASAKVREK